MQLSINRVAHLMQCERILHRVLRAVLEDRGLDQAYNMTQADADAVAAELLSLAKAEGKLVQHGEWVMLRGLDTDPLVDQFDCLRSINTAAAEAKALFELCGLTTPASLLDGWRT